MHDRGTSLYLTQTWATAESATTLCALSGHSGRVNCLRWLPAGESIGELASASSDGTIAIWANKKVGPLVFSFPPAFSSRFGITLSCFASPHSLHHGLVHHHVGDGVASCWRQRRKAPTATKKGPDGTLNRCRSLIPTPSANKRQPHPPPGRIWMESSTHARRIRGRGAQ